jgi:hypothetical protein
MNILLPQENTANPMRAENASQVIPESIVLFFVHVRVRVICTL